MSEAGQKDKQAELAARALGEMWRERWLDRIRRTFARSSWPDGWEDTVRACSAVRFLTAEEAGQVADEINEIFQRYEDRRHDPSLRPEGARPVEFTYFGFPLAEFSEDTSEDTSEET